MYLPIRYPSCPPPCSHLHRPPWPWPFQPRSLVSCHCHSLQNHRHQCSNSPGYQSPPAPPAVSSTGPPRWCYARFCLAVVAGPFVTEESLALLSLPTHVVVLGNCALASVLRASRKQLRHLLPLWQKKIVRSGTLSRGREPSVADVAGLLKAPSVSKRALQRQKKVHCHHHCPPSRPVGLGSRPWSRSAPSSSACSCRPPSWS